MYPEEDILLAYRLKLNDLLRRLDGVGTGKDRKMLQQDIDQLKQSIARHEQRKSVYTAESAAAAREQRLFNLAASLFARSHTLADPDTVRVARNAIADAETFLNEWDRRGTA